MTPQTNGVQPFEMDDHMNVSSMVGLPQATPNINASFMTRKQANPSLLEDLKKQVEFYFSSANFPKDTYLQTLAVTYGGLVPVVSILNFPRVRQLVASAANPHHSMNQQQAEIRLLATALENSTTLGISHDGLWIFAPGQHPAPVMHQQQAYTKQVPYSATPIHPGIMFANGNIPMSYNMAPQYSHGPKMDHPQHLLPRSMPTYPSATSGSTNNNHNHHHNSSKRHQSQHQRRQSQGSNKNEGGNTNNIGHKDKKQGKQRNKKNRAGFQNNAVVSRGNGGNRDGGKPSEQGPAGRDSKSLPTENKPSGNAVNKSSGNNSKKKRQSFKKEQKKQQPVGGSSSSNIVAEDFPSLTKKSYKKANLANPSNGYAQALLKKAPISSGPSSEDSNSTATTVNSDMEKLAVSDDSCW